MISSGRIGTRRGAFRAAVTHSNDRRGVRRIERLTGRNLGSLADQAGLLLTPRLSKSAAEQQ